MTLIELINKVMDEGALNKAIVSMYLEYYDDQPMDEIDTIAHSYNKVIRDILEATPDDQSIDTYNILVKEETDDIDPDDVQTYTDVSLYNKKESKTYAMDCTSWTELINMEITSEIDTDIYGLLAHILWEITFYGFSLHDIEAAKGSMMKQVQEIEDGTATLIPLSGISAEDLPF